MRILCFIIVFTFFYEMIKLLRNFYNFQNKVYKQYKMVYRMYLYPIYGNRNIYIYTTQKSELIQLKKKKKLNNIKKSIIILQLSL